MEKLLKATLVDLENEADLEADDFAMATKFIADEIAMMNFAANEPIIIQETALEFSADNSFWWVEKFREVDVVVYRKLFCLY